jgi:hypothetical protein
MSILSSVTSIFEPTKYLGIPSEECKPTKSGDRGDDKHNGKNDDHEKQAKNDDHRDDRDKQAKSDDRKDDHEKQAKNDDHRDDHDKQARNDDHKADPEKQAKNDDHRDDHDKQTKSDDHRDDHDKQAKSDDHKDDHDKQAKNDDHSKHASNDDCQPQKDHCESKPSDDCGKGDNPGDALCKLDLSHGNLGLQGPDHTGDVHAALASMSPDHALDYAIGQMGPADHADVGHFDVPADTSHDMGHHA